MYGIGIVSLKSFKDRKDKHNIKGKHRKNILLVNCIQTILKLLTEQLIQESYDTDFVLKIESLALLKNT